MQCNNYRKINKKKFLRRNHVKVASDSIKAIIVTRSPGYYSSNISIGLAILIYWLID